MLIWRLILQISDLDLNNSLYYDLKAKKDEIFDNTLKTDEVFIIEEQRKPG